jgi:hypothetical protein
VTGGELARHATGRHTPASVIKERYARIVREYRLVTRGQRKATAVSMALVEVDERHQACDHGFR